MPIVLQWLLALVVSMAAAWLLRPKANKSPQASTLEPPGDAEMSTVNEGVEIPVMFGVVWSGDSTVVWWGDTKVKTRTYQEAVQV